MSDEIFQKLDQIIKECKPSVKILKKDFNLRNDLDLDSLDMMNFFFEIEKVFDIKIPDEDIEGNELNNISNIIKYIEKRVKVE